MRKYSVPIRRMINLAGALKGFFGTIGGSAILMDYKYTGLGILLVGAFLDQLIIFLKREQEETISDIPADATTPTTTGQ